MKIIKNITVLLLCLPLLFGCARVQKAMGTPPAEPVLSTPVPTIAPSPSPEPTPKPLLPVELVDFCIDKSLFAPATEQGEIFITEYETQNYVSGDASRFKKQMGVYLPYGYDPDKQYDVVFLMHTSGADENFWLMYGMSYAHPDCGYIDVSIPNLLDNMIEKGYCKPVIVMTPDGYPDDEARYNHNSALAYSQFEREFAEDILPFVAQHYGTYAEGPSRAELSAARDHFAFLGASFGAYMNYLSIMPENFDLVSNFAVVGGGEINYYTLQDAWTACGTHSLPVNCLYIGEGEYDDRAGPEGSYLALKTQTHVFNEDNLYFTLFSQTGHEDRAWINTLFNSLQLFFR